MRLFGFSCRFLDSRVSAHKRLAGGIHFVGELPKTGSGKVQRRRLKEMTE